MPLTVVYARKLTAPGAPEFRAIERTARRYARRPGAREIVVGVPCASDAAAREFEHAADRCVCLTVDPEFAAVGHDYDDFSCVSDDDVIAMLAGERPTPHSSSS